MSLLLSICVFSFPVSNVLWFRSSVNMVLCMRYVCLLRLYVMCVWCVCVLFMCYGCRCSCACSLYLFVFLLRFNVFAYCFVYFVFHACF